MTGARQPAPAASAKGARTTTSQAAAGGRIVLPFEDNRLMAGLLGPHDAHLALIEQKLSVNARADGNIVTITGSADACAMAKDVLEHLYSRVRSGVPLTRGDVEGAIRHAERAGIGAESVGIDGATGMAQIRTRKRLISARTPAPERLHSRPGRYRSRVRRRAGRHRQDLSCRRLWRGHARAWTDRADHSLAPRRRGRRTTGVPARRYER